MTLGAPLKKPLMVYCAVCKVELPINYLECPECGAQNPQRHLIERKSLTVLIDVPVYRALEKLSIKTGRPIDDLATEAIEDMISRKNRE